MKTDANRLLKLLGLRPTGDIGPYTIYTSKRHATTIFQKSPPLKPPSPKQIAWRNRWRAAAAAWRELPLSQRQAWISAARAAGLAISGHNLWFWFNLAGDVPTIRTIERQSGIQLLAPQS